MSKQTWAAIIYGRTYHLDFRFITIPQDFAVSETAWVSSHILATTQQARNLSSFPRWSLFKNNTHCVMGVTCMVRDLIGKSAEDTTEMMAKDDQGRPLYVFVGYVTQLNPSTNLAEFPAYTGERLTSFQHLYQEIEPVWLARDYNNRDPFLSEYESLDVAVNIVDASLDVHFSSPLNNIVKYPDKTFVWQCSTEQNNQLWLAAAQSQVSTSVCLDIKGKQLVNSPFLNQTITKIQQFTVRDRIVTRNRDRVNSPIFDSLNNHSKQPTLTQKISNRAKDDIDLTLQQAAKMTSASQELINNLTGNGNSKQDFTERSSSTSDSEIFGLKTKKSDSSTEDKDWF